MSKKTMPKGWIERMRWPENLPLFGQTCITPIYGTKDIRLEARAILDEAGQLMKLKLKEN